MSIFVFEPICIASRPIRRINAPLHQPMKRRMRPIPHTPDQAMLERIDVNVIHVRSKIYLVANQMFPTTALPYAPLAARHANLGTPLGFW